MPGPPPLASGSSLGLLIRQVRDGIWAQLERELARVGHDLTFSQYIALKKLADGSSPSVTDLARAAELNPGAMTRLLDKLEQRGLIARTADPADRRALHIHLTEAGAGIWQDVSICGQRVLERATTGMSTAEAAQLMTLLAHVRDNLSPPTG